MSKYDQIPNIEQCIEILGDCIQENGIITKRSYHLYALDTGAIAMQEQGEKETYIRILRYQVDHPGAWLFPDGLTKAALNAAWVALKRKAAAEEGRK